MFQIAPLSPFSPSVIPSPPLTSGPISLSLCYGNSPSSCIFMLQSRRVRQTENENSKQKALMCSVGESVYAVCVPLFHPVGHWYHLYTQGWDSFPLQHPLPLCFLSLLIPLIPHPHLSATDRCLTFFPAPNGTECQPLTGSDILI